MNSLHGQAQQGNQQRYLFVPITRRCLACHVVPWVTHAWYVGPAGFHDDGCNEAFLAGESWLDTAFTLPATPPPAAESPTEPHLPNRLSEEGYANDPPLFRTAAFSSADLCQIAAADAPAVCTTPHCLSSIGQFCLTAYSKYPPCHEAEEVQSSLQFLAIGAWLLQVNQHGLELV